MSFNPIKHAQEVIVSRKRQNINHDSIYFNHNLAQKVLSQKHLGMHVDTNLNFHKNLDNIISKADSFAASCCYGDIMYDQAYKESFHQKLGSIQYNAALAIAGAIRGTSREKLYQELGLESLQKQRWYRKFCYFLKILKGQSPLSKKLPSIRRAYKTRNVDYTPCFNSKHNFFRNSFSPPTLTEWNNLDINIRNSESYASFKKSILRFIRPSENPIFNCCNPSGIKLINRSRLGLSRFLEHKLRHNFQDTLNPICSCGEIIEPTTHYLLYCSNSLNERMTLLTNLQDVE